MMFDVVDLGEVVDEVAACYGMSGGGDEAWVSAPQTGWEWKESHKLGPAHRVRFWTAKSSKKSAFLELKKVL